MQRSIRSLLLLLLFVSVTLAAVPSLTAPALAVEACHGATSCSGPASCGAWSGYYDCEVPYCVYSGLCAKYGELALYQPTEQFRACILADGSTCFEYSSVRNSFRGCGC